MNESETRLRPAAKAALRTVIMKLTPALALSLLLHGALSAGPTPAFPGAEGAGAFAQGGRGGRVIAVTNLNDSGPGSLRAAVQAKGPRTVVFRVAGNIELGSTLEIKEPFITIAGQSAPGDGVCLKNYDCVISTQQVVIRYLRVRPGDVARKAVDGFSIGGAARHVILDHCSATWSVDESLSVSGGDIGDITVQWCLIAESLNQSVHHKGPHGYGSLIRADGEVSYHHNIFALHKSRNPRPGTYEDANKRGLILDFRNNVIYGWGARAGYSSADKANLNYVGNYLKPAAFSHAADQAFDVGGRLTTALYVADNFLAGATTANQDNWLLIGKSANAVRRDQPFPIAPVTTDPVSTVYEKVLAGAGATRPVRDAVDARIARHIREGTGRIIDSQKEVGGWPELATGMPPIDSDQDGLPDDWEKQHQLDPQNPRDGAKPAASGYTQLEEFLNSRA